MLATENRADILTALGNARLSRLDLMAEGKDTSGTDAYIDQLLDALTVA